MTVLQLPKLLTEAEASRALGLSIDTVMRLRRAGRIRHRRLGTGRGRIRYTEGDILDYLNSTIVEGICQGETENRDSMATIGFQSAPEATTGTAHGLTAPLDKPAAFHLAHATLKPPKSNLLNGMWRTAN